MARDPDIANPVASWQARAVGYVMLPHPWPILMVLLATAGFALVLNRGVPEPGRFALMLLTMFGGQIAIGAHNEHVDRHDDARAQPWKPMARGLVSPTGALVMLVAGLVILLASGAALGWLALTLAVAGTACGFAYNQWFKRSWLSWLPYALALPLIPIWVSTVFGRFEPHLFLLYAIGLPVVVAVHLAQTLPDIAGDRALGHAGLAARLGRRRARRAIWAGSLLVVAVVALAGPFLPGPWLAAVAGAGAAGLTLLVGWAVTRRLPDQGDRVLFRFVAVAALCLMIGWAISVGF